MATNTGIAKKRDSNIELFRIIMMLAIVAHHYVVNSGVMAVLATPPYSWNHYFLYVFGMWGKIGINCFVLITGFFMCKLDITLRKFLKLLLEVMFYNIVCYLAFLLTRYAPFSVTDLYNALNPIPSLADNFVGCFLVYYLLIPFLNVMVRNLTQKQHKLLLALCVLFFVLMDHLPLFDYRFNYVGWFCVLHVIAAYIRFYPDERKVRSGYYIIGGALLAIAAVMAQVKLIEIGLPVGKPYKWVTDCNALIALVSSLLLFMGFKNIRLPYNKWINLVANSTFAVFLIHTSSDTMRRWLWQDVCHNTDWVFSPYMPLHAIGCVLAVFVACTVIDQIRIYLLEKPAFVLIDKWLVKSEQSSS